MLNFTGMSTEQTLQGKLQNIERGARGFRVLSIVCVVLGCVALLPAALELRHLLEGVAMTEVLSNLVQRTLGAVQLFVFAWLSSRVSDAFESIAGLIAEIGEIV